MDEKDFQEFTEVVSSDEIRLDAEQAAAAVVECYANIDGYPMEYVTLRKTLAGLATQFQKEFKIVREYFAHKPVGNDYFWVSTGQATSGRRAN